MTSLSKLNLYIFAISFLSLFLQVIKKCDHFFSMGVGGCIYYNGENNSEEQTKS